MTNVEPIKKPDLPEGIDPDAWEGFVEMRISKRKPLTQYAEKLMLKKLVRLSQEGHDPNLLLERSILNGWQDVWPDDSTKRKSRGHRL